MIQPIVWVLLATYISLVSAFFPITASWCTPALCPDVFKFTKRSLERAHNKRSHVASLNNALTFELRQRMPKVGLSHEARLESLVNRLTKKYASRAQARTATAGVEARGTNNYNIVISNTPTQSMSVALDQDGTDFSYFASVNFGSKNKALYLLMDTGASSTWVMGSSCTTEACAQHNSFGPSDSTTYQSTTNPFAINYGSGVVNGTYASDSVSFAGMSFSLDFGSAAYTSNDFLSFPMDGIMGLALNNGSVPNIMQTIKSAKILSSNIFGVNINRNSDGLKNGEVTFGAIDTTKYTGSLTYTSVASGSAGDWVIPVDDVGFKGTKAGATGRDAYIDTGTSFVFIPAADAAKLYANIPGSVLSSDGTSYSVPCSTTDSIQFYFSGVAYSVQAKDWVGGQSGSSSLCTSNIYARSLVGDNAWLLGDTFLKNVYAVFDIDQNRIGFGVKAQSSATSTVSSSAHSTSSSVPVIISTTPVTSSTIKATSTSPSPVTTTSSNPLSATASSAPTSTLSGSTTITPASSSSSGSAPFVGGHSDIASSTINAAQTTQATTTSSPAAASSSALSAAETLRITTSSLVFAILATSFGLAI